MEIANKGAPHSEEALLQFEQERVDALKRIAPNILEDDTANWQQRKSTQTRNFLLETTMACLAEHGYALTTTQLVTQTAKISRGALLHHFPTKAELIKQVIEYIFYRQTNNFYSAILALTAQQLASEVESLDMQWQAMQSIEFQAYQELAMASRTSPQLREIFEPKDIAYQDLRRDLIPRLFPYWDGRGEELQLARDLVISSMHGLLINSHHIKPSARRAKLRRFIAQITIQLMNGEISMPKLDDPQTQELE